jgi:ABC-type protease/lipase transport system fused ATPase/permease subunit
MNFAQSLPEDFETLCGSQGVRFSDVQRQRIDIARPQFGIPPYYCLTRPRQLLTQIPSGRYEPRREQ